MAVDHSAAIMAAMFLFSVAVGLATYHWKSIREWFSWIYGKTPRAQIKKALAGGDPSNESLALGLTNALHRIDELEATLQAFKLYQARKAEDGPARAATRGFTPHRKAAESLAMEKPLA